MRITNRTMVNTFLNNLNTNLKNMQKVQNQMSSGKEISKPSDDPYAATRSMELNSAINRNNQYLSNIDDSIGWLDTTDTALGQITDSLQRIKELMISSTSGTNTQTELDANKAEILQKIEEISQAGNTMFDGKYIFAGNNTTTQPFKVLGAGDIEYIDRIAPADPNMSTDGPINKEISAGVVVKINVSADEFMKYRAMNSDGTPADNLDGTPKYINLIDTLNSIKTNLSSGGDLSQIGGDLLDQTENHIDNILRYRGEAGAKYNRMESARDKNEEETYNTTSMLSKVEDINLAEKVMEYKVMESVYNASLMTNAKILQQSLIDFLR